MDDRNPSPASSSSSNAVTNRGHRHRLPVEEDDHFACTGKSCQSCTAGVIADCVAVCCCPCAVVNFLALAFFKLPWAVAKKCISGCRKKRSRRTRMLEEEEEKEEKRKGIDGNWEKGRVESRKCSSAAVIGGAGEERNDDFGVEVRAEDVWLELYEVGHLGFGRVSFTGAPFHDKGN